MAMMRQPAKVAMPCGGVAQIAVNSASLLGTFCTSSFCMLARACKSLDRDLTGSSRVSPGIPFLFRLSYCMSFGAKINGLTLCLPGAAAGRDHSGLGCGGAAGPAKLLRRGVRSARSHHHLRYSHFRRSRALDHPPRLCVRGSPAEKCARDQLPEHACWCCVCIFVCCLTPACAYLKVISSFRVQSISCLLDCLGFEGQLQVQEQAVLFVG